MLLKLTKFGIKYAERWFDDKEFCGLKRNLIVRNIQCQKPTRGLHFCKQTFKSVVIDLEQNEEDIFGNFRKKLRYELRQKKSQNLTFSMYRSVQNDEVRQVIDKYDRFAEERSIVKINLQRLNELEKCNNLYISQVINNKTKGMSSHFYLRASDHIRLLYSLNDIDKSIKTDQFLNKFLHWWDIKYFRRNATASIYDFGGVSENKNTANIDKFKRSFSSRYETSYKYWSILA